MSAPPRGEFGGQAARRPEPRVLPEALVASLFFVVVGALAWTRALHDDEGYLTFLGARVFAEAPLDTLFFQKFHPTLSASMAPLAALGWRAFALGHAATAAAAVFFVGAVGRRHFGSHGWVAGLLIALSPLFVLSACTGQSNSAGVFWLALAMFLHRGTPGSRVAAGLVAGLSLWTRYEQAPYLLAFVAADALRYRDARLIAGFAAAPIAYVGAGAGYHGDPLWVLSWPPVLPREITPSTMGPTAASRETLALVLGGLLQVSPAVGFALAAVSSAATQPVLRALSAAFVGTFALQHAMPIAGGHFNFDYTPRYALNHLAASSLIAAGVLATWEPGKRRGATVLAALAALAVVVAPRAGTAIGAAALAYPVVATRLARRAATAGLVGMAAVALVVGVAARGGGSATRHDPALVAGLEAAAGGLRGTDIYTNAHNLDALLAESAAGADVHFLPAYDVVAELGALLHPPPHRQATAVLDAVGPLLYGGAVWPCAFPRQVGGGSLFIADPDDTRFAAVHAADAWRAASDAVGRAGRFEVRRVRSDTLIPAAVPPDWMPRDALCLPCATPCAIAEP